jgi:tRNA pseudouridine synthase 10
VEFCDWILERAEKVLAKFPLCDACLGRLYAKLGLGLSNAERGRSIKTLISMRLHALYSRGEVSRDYFENIALNAGSAVASTYTRLFNTSLKPRECFLCRNSITQQLFEKIAVEAIRELEKHSVSSFLVGVKLTGETRDRELQVLLECGINYAESIKREIKREVGKIIRDKSPFKPDFANPEALVTISFNNDFTSYRVEVEVKPILLYGRYWKLARRISQVPWLTSSGVKKYPLSVQEYVEKIFRELLGASRAIIHAAGREDVDARMLGSGRPLVVEVKSPARRRVDLEEIRKHLETWRADPVVLSIEGAASRKTITALKELSKRTSKVYRVCVYSLLGDIDESDLLKLEEVFKNVSIHQKTPLRVLRRKKGERERVRRVYAVKTFKISSTLFEALIHCDGGLYVKELVHGDQGRTTPSFSSTLNKVLIPVELDVLYVERQFDPHGISRREIYF